MCQREGCSAQAVEFGYYLGDCEEAVLELGSSRIHGILGLFQVREGVHGVREGQEGEEGEAYKDR